MTDLRDMLPLLAGVALVLIGITWWAIVRRRRAGSALLREAVADADPEVRRAAVALIGKEGVRRHAGLLLDMTRHERDRTVLTAIAEAVSQNLWEPANNRPVVELRLWAQRQLRVGDDGVRQAEAAERARKWDGPTPAPVVLVTGAGGAAGVAVIEALRAAGITTVGADADSSAAGIRLAHQGASIPRSDDPAFVEGVVRLADRTGARALISTVAEEMVALNEAEDELAAAGLATWLPSSATIQTCIDKWRFAQAVRDAGVPAPATSLDLQALVPGPWIVKPRFGRGSRDVHRADEAAELKFANERVPEPIVQTRLRGMEFTVDALVDRDGSLVAAVPRWRLETKAGISSKGRTFRDGELHETVARLLAALGLTGPANIQGFVTAEDGTAVFVEVNPRFSGGLPLSLAAGADLVGEYLRGIVGMPLRPDRLRYQPGVSMMRYLGNVFES